MCTLLTVISLIAKYLLRIEEHNVACCMHVQFQLTFKYFKMLKGNNLIGQAETYRMHNDE